MGNRILILHDREEIQVLLKTTLALEGYEPILPDISATAIGLEDIRAIMPDLAIINCLMLDEVPGWLLIVKMKEDPQLVHIPVIVCTSTNRLTPAQAEIMQVMRIRVISDAINIDELLDAVHASLNP